MMLDMNRENKAFVAGAPGVVGRHLVAHLDGLGDWEVVGLSRRKPEADTSAHISVDLSNRADCEAKLGAVNDVSHIFYAARAPRPDFGEEADVNRELLANLVETVEQASPGLKHIHVVHGTKWYGCQMGPFKTPSREDDPRQLQPSFYYTQQDYLAEREPAQQWTWSSVRPPLVCGFSTGYPHNLLTSIAVYASVSKALGLPLRFPGNQGCFDSLYQAVDAGLLARASYWTATEPTCANQAYNITNGDAYRWCHLWPRLAEFFEMEAGGVQELKLAERMPRYAPVWDKLVAKHGLQNYSMEALATWPFADLMFSLWWDDISSVIKCRQQGFTEAMDTEDMFIAQLAAMRAARIIP